VPGLSERLSRQLAELMHRLRRVDLYKLPGVAESIDWAEALRLLGVEQLSAEQLELSAGCFLKHQDDVERLRNGLGAELLEAVLLEAVGAS